MRKTLRGDSRNFCNVLLSLGYIESATNEYRKGKFHIIVHAKEQKERIEIHMHVDYRYAPPMFRHTSRQVGKDIEGEYRKIMRRYHE